MHAWWCGAVLAAAAVSAPLGWLLVGCQHAVVLVPHELQCRWPGRGGVGVGAVRPHRHKHSTHVLCMYIGGTETDGPVGSRDQSHLFSSMAYSAWGTQ